MSCRRGACRRARRRWSRPGGSRRSARRAAARGRARRPARGARRSPRCTARTRSGSRAASWSRERGGRRSRRRDPRPSCRAPPGAASASRRARERSRCRVSYPHDRASGARSGRRSVQEGPRPLADPPEPPALRPGAARGAHGAAALRRGAGAFGPPHRDTMTDFKGLLRALTDANVEFILVGGVAATVHGSTRLTLDVDAVYRRTPENIARLVRALAPHAPYLRGAPPRSEEHTSELQSRLHLVCRLLLEKKKKTKAQPQLKRLYPPILLASHQALRPISTCFLTTTAPPAL